MQAVVVFLVPAFLSVHLCQVYLGSREVNAGVGVLTYSIQDAPQGTFSGALRSSAGYHGHIVERTFSTENLTTIDLARLSGLPRYLSLWHLQRFLVCNTNLRTLTCCDKDLRELVTRTPLNINDAVSLPNVTSLALCGTFSTTHGYTAYITPPSLRKLACFVFVYDEEADRLRERFFRTYGSLMIKERCPGLRRLALTIVDGK
ncbi:hypothetical protein BS17DRAFT_821578 [Gyrodon lividus]|nr:hypothetical protein BS17DRAFT_821578 [Gyrodon lividus]